MAAIVGVCCRIRDRHLAFDLPVSSFSGGTLFDNLLYHSIRSSEGLIGWWGEKLVLVVQLFLGSSEGNGLQWSILFFVSAGLISLTARRSSCRLAFRIAIFLALVCLLPTPTYLQYFSLCVPFLIVSAVLRCR